MSGPVEIVVLAFPGSRFSGRILPELDRLLAAGTITLVDCLLVSRGEDGSLSYVEVDGGTGADGTDDGGADQAEVERLAGLLSSTAPADGLVSAEDVEELAADLEPGSSAAVLAFEHTWMGPLRDAVLDAGGVVAADVRIPADVVEAVAAELASA